MGKILEEVFGRLTPLEDNNLVEPRDVKHFTLTNASGMSVKVMSYGAAITSILVPDKNGSCRDVILGFDNLDGYLGKHGPNPFFGATVGRVANRIRDGKFAIDGKMYQVSVNNGSNHLHGGFHGFDKRFWESKICVEQNNVVFTYISKDGEEGYPGEMKVETSYEITDDNELKICYKATTNQPTPICLTNHAHFNLGGHQEGSLKLRNHVIEINANEYTPVDEGITATGEIKEVTNTIFDLRSAKNFETLLKAFEPGPNGYDINFCVNKVTDSGVNFVGCVTNSESGIGMKTFSTQLGVQLYTSNFFPDLKKFEIPICGKGGAQYAKHGAFCLETQNFPNAINIPGFPSAVLRPRETYEHCTIYKFFQMK